MKSVNYRGTSCHQTDESVIAPMTDEESTVELKEPHVLSPFTRSIDPPDHWQSHHNTGHMQVNGYDPDEKVVLIWFEERKRDEILDDRRKQQAAIKGELVPAFVKFVGTNPLAYVEKKAHRQHLDASQRAVMAAKILETKHSGSCKFAGSGINNQTDAARV